MPSEETPTMNIFDKIRLISEYAPLLSYLQQLANADEVTDKVSVAADAAEWIATKTEMEWDDEVVSLVADILRSDEGAALIEWIVEKMKDGSAE